LEKRLAIRGQQENKKSLLIFLVASMVFARNAANITSQQELDQRFMKRFRILNQLKLLKQNGVFMLVSVDFIGSQNQEKYRTKAYLERICNHK